MRVSRAAARFFTDWTWEFVGPTGVVEGDAAATDEAVAAAIRVAAASTPGVRNLIRHSSLL